MSKKISKKEVQQVIEHLETRIIDVRQNSDLKHYTSIVPVSDVFIMLSVLKKKKTKKYFKKLDKTREELYRIANLR